jgi:hypothetical protein
MRSVSTFAAALLLSAAVGGTAFAATNASPTAPTKQTFHHKKKVEAPKPVSNTGPATH